MYTVELGTTDNMVISKDEFFLNSLPPVKTNDIVACTVGQWFPVLAGTYTEQYPQHNTQEKEQWFLQQHETPSLCDKNVVTKN